MDDCETEIYLKNQQMRYVLRPQSLESLCLACFMSEYKMVSRRQNKGNPLEHRDSGSDEESLDVSVKLSDGSRVQKMKNSRHHRILRFVGYGFLNDREAYFREQILLYYPYRGDDDNTLLGSCSSFEERYNQVKSVVERNRKMFEPFKEQIEKAQQLLTELPEDGDHLNVIAPNLRCLDDLDVCLDLDEGRKIISNFQSTSLPVHETTPGFMEEMEFIELVSKLNEEQQSFLLEILIYERKRLFRKDIEQLFPFLSGGAGTGKSLLIKCLYQTLLRLFKSTEIDPSKPSVSIAAFTASAARNVDGVTIHSLLSLSPDFERALAMSAETESKLRHDFAQLRVLIIDEIWLVGNYFFHVIDQRLRRIKNIDQPFGGVTVVCVEDLFQLPPVKDSYVFKMSGKIVGCHANETLWSKYQMHELKTIMRQNEKDWCELLNRLREGDLQGEDWDVLNELKNNHIPEGSLRICAIRKNVEARNNQVMNSFGGEAYESLAFDRKKDLTVDEKTC